jgi:hypothetical protein
MTSKSSFFSWRERASTEEVGIGTHPYERDWHALQGNFSIKDIQYHIDRRVI